MKGATLRVRVLHHMLIISIHTSEKEATSYPQQKEDISLYSNICSREGSDPLGFTPLKAANVHYHLNKIELYRMSCNHILGAFA